MKSDTPSKVPSFCTRPVHQLTRLSGRREPLGGLPLEIERGVGIEQRADEDALPENVQSYVITQFSLLSELDQFGYGRTTHTDTPPTYTGVSTTMLVAM